MSIAEKVVLAAFAAATWGCFFYFVLVEPVRLYLRRRPHPRQGDFDERAASALLYPTTERRVVGQPATPFDLTNNSARGVAAPGRPTTSERG